ncbi:MAG: long-chain fatty acid--CoA ligase, partial [Acidimicrobiia bacterium]|nr:long-chain fatty acid--CoA ligase [Acidimicrobiia bacterium]
MTTTVPRAAIVGVQTPASLLRDLAATRPHDVALRAKTRGIWREISWAAYWENVETFAHALIASGIDEEDR